MNVLLSKIADIKSGCPFPRRLEPTDAGVVAVFQMKDLPYKLQLESAAPVCIDNEGIKDRYLLATNDIIFRSRGQINTATIIKMNLDLAVVAAPLLSLRVKSDAVLPGYLCWWINQPVAQVHFERHAKGTSVRMISRDALAHLQVPLLPIAKQRQIVELAVLGEREQGLLSRLAEAEQAKLSGILIKTAMEA